MRSMRSTAGSSRRRFALGVSAVVALLATLVLASPAGAIVNEVGGGATDITVDVQPPVGDPVTQGPFAAVDLPAAGGGPFTDSFGDVSVPGVLAATLTEVATEGTAVGTIDGAATSEAVVTSANVLAGAFTADAITSTCTADTTGTTGSVVLVNPDSTLDPGVVVDANPAPNTSIDVAGLGTVILNEQIVTAEPGVEATITVNAVRITLDPAVGTGEIIEIIIAQSVCEAIGPDVLKSPPVINDDDVDDPEGDGVTFDPTENDTDADGDALCPTEVTQPENGTVVINDDCTVTYTPNDGFTGTDTFQITVCDETGDCGTSTATVTVGEGGDGDGAGDGDDGAGDPGAGGPTSPGGIPVPNRIDTGAGGNAAADGGGTNPAPVLLMAGGAVALTGLIAARRRRSVG